MKKQMMTLAAVLMAGAAVTSCSSDNEMDSPKAPAAKTYTMTVSVTKGGDETRALSLSGEGEKTLNATWATTENVYVKKGSDWAEGSLQPQANGTTATLKGTLSGDVTFAANDNITLQFPQKGEITYAGQKGTLADIAANFDWATATATVASVEDGKITVADNVTFTNQQAVVKFTLTDNAATPNAIKPTALTINDGTNDIVTLTGITDDIYTTNGEGVLYVAIPGFSGKAITLTATVGEDTYTYEKSNVTFTNGKYYRVTAKMAKQAAGALSGQFTINSSGDKVYFSKGNLQYQASTSTWRFAEHQYDYVGDATNGNVKVGETKSNNASISSSYDGWIDLFGWGTSGKTFASGYGSAYQPYATSTTSTAYGPSGNYNLIGTYADGDWGVNMGSGWRTLTGGDNGEWKYLFNTRTVNNGQGNGKSYTLGQKVNDVLGVVLYPDDYTGAAYTTGSNWSTFESAGCVFLPAAGYRNGTSVSNVGSNGRYWSSTANGTGRAYNVSFGSGSVNPAIYNGLRDGGFSVRLVRPVE